VMPAGEVADPRRNAPFALLIGIAFVVVLYLLIQFVSIGTLPTLADSTRPLADAAAGFMGPIGGTIITAGALISITGTLNVITMVSPRLPFAMAEKGQLPRIFAATHPRYHTPWVSILVSAAVMLVLTLQGSFISSLTISTVIRLVTYAATCAALPVLRKRAGEDIGAFRAPAGIVVAVAAIALCAWLLSTALSQLRLTAIAAVIGLVLYFVFRGRGAPTASEAAAR
jgi:APA family basic amino acid/polyamine antiporter